MGFMRKYPLLILVAILLLSSCGDRGRELVVGSYTNEETIVFSEDKETDEKVIDDFKAIIEDSNPEEYQTEELPEYVVAINNPSDSTMELLVNFWINGEKEFIFRKGLNGDDFFKVSAEDSKKVEKIVGRD